ncbi:chemosensory protein 1 [Culex quinquefasciatus]|uniref:Chemosensory protein 1 n=1 Tax=Culex quinquefasciatus TaxID=7176 RepID=B0W7K3_CULQU|nr:ejaculatory bulb-specific protein 3 [Culex quinquefasciatus]EDS38038.1 chemosensory protein 1 [Culex quinquefasciatus]|eukprot:XP_001844687.1 chemosensory protein 1 [Culex quinquefasciatus]
MKLLIVFALVALVAAQDSTYTNKYDNIDVDEILKSDRLFKNYFNCLIDQGPCTPDATELKQSLPDALENNCSKCTPKQKEVGYKVVGWLINNRPEEWNVLRAKYDPENKFIEKYRDEAKAAGINL